jgi:protein-S-isoprenylcysteine O-methyltransferase Ste14
MSIGTGAVLFVIGAILAFAVHVSVGFISLSTVGWILMVAGVVVFVVGLLLAIRGRRTVSTARVDGTGTSENVTRSSTNSDGTLP